MIVFALIFSLLSATLTFGRELSLKPKLGQTPIKLHVPIHHNDDTLIITSLRAYIVIPMASNTVVQLLDLEENPTCTIPDDAKQITIGIDSLQTVDTDFSHALDPIHGMFWTWNSGYINVKIEGISQRSPQRNHVFQLHLGGYTSPFHTSFSLNIPQKQSMFLSIDLAECIHEALSKYQGIVMSPGKQAHNLMNILERSITLEE